ncbi:MAG: DUF1592 domain-containing protein [Proteobacteria bacterium]|nr:DUF1592 domain-containing protein [Pseudomonadota bacterium]MCP4922047.1 DUF1592 domain-containing protein [Pseudomonadota bacterium]
MFVLLLACQGADPVPAAEPLAPGPRLHRLTHAQWTASVQDLLFLDDASELADAFIGDTLSEGFENDAESLQVGSTLFRDYQRASESLASELVADADRYAQVVPHDDRDGPTGVEFSETIEGEDGTATEGQAESESWDLWSNGFWYADVTLPESATYTVTADVWGSDCGDGVYAKANLLVDDVLLVEDHQSSAAGNSMAATVELSAGTHTVQVEFTNDCWDPSAGADRNLWIDAIHVAGEYDQLGAGALDDPDAWIADFGRRAFRRPLQDHELSAYGALFDRGAELVGSGDDVADGVQLVVSAMLQSPHFLYRVEWSQGSGARIQLSDWEVAAKLSYALWGTTPNDALLDEAAAGRLHTPAQVRDRAQAMLEDERADAVVADFHRQLLDLDDYDNIYKSSTIWDEGLNDDLREEMERFTAMTAQDGGLRDLLTSRETWVTPELAAIYGVSGSGDVTLGADRSGLLTRAGFLASEAGAVHPSPIHRGVFLNRKILCTSLPPPPDEVTALPALEDGMTNRQRVDAHTGDGTCGEGCHSALINPLGFAFEGYDALGMIRTEDNGLPVDTQASFTFEHGAEDFADAVELSSVLAESAEAHRCYAENWFSYTMARAASDKDATRVAELGKASFADDVTVDELLIELVSSEDFLCRSPLEDE